MKPDEPPCQDHRRHVEQFIGKRPPERTESQLEHIGRNRDGVGEPDALSRENRGREYALEYFRHLVKRIRSRLVLRTPSNRVHRSSSWGPSPTAESADKLRSLCWTIPPLEYDISGMPTSRDLERSVNTAVLLASKSTKT